MIAPNREDLRDQLVIALRAVPGARVLVEFGSRQEGLADAFSDVDFQLLVEDCVEALPAFLTVLGKVVAPELEWTISDDPNHYWLMVLPDSTRPWLKVDIGLEPYRPAEQNDPGWTGTTIWTQEAPAVPLTRVHAPEWPRPAPGTLNHFVVWQLIDLGRLAKFKYRKKPLNMLKFLSQISQAVVTVEVMRLGQRIDSSPRSFSPQPDMPSTASIAALNQTALDHLTDMNASLVDHLINLSQRLCAAVEHDENLRTSCERMVAGSDEVLRETS